jgi:hypothetical protein
VNVDNRKAAISLYIVAAMCVAVVSICLFLPVIPLEHGNFIFLKAVELRRTGPIVVRISGVCADLFSVRKVGSREKGKVMAIAVYGSLASPVKLPWGEGSQSFEYDLVVPNTTKEIRLGKEGFVIWQRKDGSIEGDRK